MLKKIMREPLLHFALIGAGLFLLFAYLNPAEEQAENSIIITSYKIQQLTTVFQKKWQRLPTAVELKRLIDDYVTEEVYYREAIAMRMDQDDTVIRRRLRQKMEFLLTDVNTAIKPTDAQLQAYLDAHPATFAIPARYSFRQIYVNPNQPDGAERIAAIQQQLDAGLYVVGDSTMLPEMMTGQPANRIDRTFGQGFTKPFADMPLHHWQGPIWSGFGQHWIYLEAREASQHPALAEVRAKVLREYEYDQRQELQRKVTEKLLQKYTVQVDWPESEATSAVPAATSGYE